MKRTRIFFLLILSIIFLNLFSAEVIAADTPELVYGKCRLAIKEGNFDKMIKLIVKEKREELLKELDKLSPEDRDKAVTKLMEVLKARMPVKYRVLKSIREDDETTILYARGRIRSLIDKNIIKTRYGKIIFKKEDGEWKLLKEIWQEKPY